MGEERDTAELFEDLAAARQEVETEHDRELAQFFGYSLDFLCIAGLDGYFKHLNPAWTVRLGWSLEELTARPFLDFVHPDDRAATEAEVAGLARGEEAMLFENRYRHQDGSYRWLQWNAWPVPEQRLIFATARDVTRMRRLEREILEILDQEKERLGRELHDGLGQTLAAIAALSTALARRLANGSASDESAAAAEISRLLSEAIGEARDLARGLGVARLEDAGLEAALEDLALGVRSRFRVSCTFTRRGSLPRLRHEVESHLYRIAQEAVGNSLTHGKGDRIEISLGPGDGTGSLSVRDNGCGLPDNPADLDGIGMHTMAYRARHIGGSLEVRPRRRGGTAVTCTFPLREAVDSCETPEA